MLIVRSEKERGLSVPFRTGQAALMLVAALAPACFTIQEALFMGDPIAGEKRPSEY